jgi:UDP-2,3-diacylglucosamine pyrophosphatase LpxH
VSSHTLVVSDIHLTDAEPLHKHRLNWKRYKRAEHFIDGDFARFLEFAQQTVPGPIELVLNGDILDFDSVMARPGHGSAKEVEPEVPFHVSWLERLRGLQPEEAKSRFKLAVIHRDHREWFAALGAFILRGNRAVFVIGNHDMELYWPSVRADFLRLLELPLEARERVRFCEWFYVSNADTLIEHGNQYDSYSLAYNPINPLIRKGHRVLVRIPFGNLAGKYMLNGMGLMNPHAPGSFIRGSLWGYLEFYFKYVVRTEPFLIWTWFWGALVTLFMSVTEGLLPAMTDPFTIDTRVGEIAGRSNSSARVVWSLRELHVHPAVFNPIKILRELWLDRALLLGGLVGGCFFGFSALNVFVAISGWWFVLSVVVLLPLFLFYAQSVQSEVEETQRNAYRLSPVAARIAGVSRVVQGHTHREGHHRMSEIEYLNTGTWSPAYRDVECTEAFGRKCFAWIKPPAGGGDRVAELYEWTASGPQRIVETPLEVTASLL